MYVGRTVERDLPCVDQAPPDLRTSDPGLGLLTPRDVGRSVRPEPSTRAVGTRLLGDYVNNANERGSTGHAGVALEFIRDLYRVEPALADRESPSACAANNLRRSQRSSKPGSKRSPPRSCHIACSARRSTPGSASGPSSASFLPMPTCRSTTTAARTPSVPL